VYIWGVFGFVLKEKSLCSVFIIRFSDAHITNTGEEKGVWGVYHIFAVCSTPFKSFNSFESISNLFFQIFLLIISSNRSIRSLQSVQTHTNPSNHSHPENHPRHFLSHAKPTLHCTQSSSLVTIATCLIRSGRLLWTRKTMMQPLQLPAEWEAIRDPRRR
jgi:hypothetical protein